MKPILLALSAMIIYAIQNVIMEQKLSKYSVFPLLVYFYLAMLPMAVCGWFYLRFTNQSIFVPSGPTILVALALGLMFFAADSCYVGAYTNGGSVIVVGTIVALFPAIASTVKYFWKGSLPNIYQILGYSFALLAVFLLAKGNTLPSLR